MYIQCLKAVVEMGLPAMSATALPGMPEPQPDRATPTTKKAPSARKVFIRFIDPGDGSERWQDWSPTVTKFFGTVTHASHYWWNAGALRDESNVVLNNLGHRWTQREVVALAEGQNGVVAHWQLRGLGVPADVIQYRLAESFLTRLHRGVYAVGRRVLPPNGHRMAAVLSYKPPCVLSHRSAAAVWGIWSSGPRIEVMLERKSRSHVKIRAHYTARLDPEDVTTKDNIPITSPARTVLDLARTLKPHLLVKAIEEAERRHIFDLMALDRAIARAPRRPAPGSSKPPSLATARHRTPAHPWSSGSTSSSGATRPSPSPRAMSWSPASRSISSGHGPAWWSRSTAVATTRALAPSRPIASAMPSSPGPAAPCCGSPTSA